MKKFRDKEKQDLLKFMENGGKNTKELLKISFIKIKMKRNSEKWCLSFYKIK